MIELTVYNKIDNNQGGQILLNNTVIGNFSIIFMNNLPILRMIYIDKSYQKKGYGSKALSKINQYFNNQLHTHIGADTWVVNKLPNKPLIKL